MHAPSSTGKIILNYYLLASSCKQKSTKSMHESTIWSVKQPALTRTKTEVEYFCLKVQIFSLLPFPQTIYALFSKDCRWLTEWPLLCFILFHPNREIISFACSMWAPVVGVHSLAQRTGSYISSSWIQHLPTLAFSANKGGSVERKKGSNITALRCRWSRGML